MIEIENEEAKAIVPNLNKQNQENKLLQHSSVSNRQLPPLKIPKPPTNSRTIRSLLQLHEQQKKTKRLHNFSISSKVKDEKYLQDYNDAQKQKLVSLSVEKVDEIQKKKLFQSAKMPKNVKLQPIELKPYLKNQKEQYKLREESIMRYLSQSNILQNYKMLSHLGKGSFSIVSLAVNKETNQRFAIKTYTKIDEIESYKFDNIYKQITNLNKLNHQNVVGLFHVVKDKRKLHLIMEDGGKLSLAGLLRKNKTISEAQTKKIFRQIIKGVNYCHQQGISHRDLKLENILVDNDSNVKIIDFGFSARSGQKLQNFCGTPPYMAPQITSKLPYHGEPADMWALGIILYLMLYGKFPFRASSQKELYRIIQQGKFEMGEGISLKVKQNISKLLKCNNRQRITAEQMLNGSWLQSDI